MAELSSYLRRLPPVLWQGDPAPPGFSLGTTLRIFEKVLTGIDDDVDVRHGDHTHPAIGDLVARQHELFDPWRTPPEFLPYLASWVGLRFPTRQGQPLWNEYQQRRATAEISGIERQRGLRDGLNRYLDLYTVGLTRPRVTLDDGRPLLVTRPRPGRLAPLAGLVTQGPVLAGGLATGAVVSDGLIRPQCVTTALDGSTLFVGDTGAPSGSGVPLKSRVFRISATGGYDLTGTPPHPQPLVGSDVITSPVAALAVRPAADGLPENLYILDRSGKLYALPAPYAGKTATQVTTVAPGGNTTIAPVAMALDTNNDLLILDRGDGPGTINPPKIITVKPSPLGVTRKNLTTVQEPLSLLVQPDGKLIIGDGGNQAPTGPAQFPGNLVQVTRSGAIWTEAVLLPAANPLIAPTGLARSGGRLYVLDAGLKPFTPPNVDPFVLDVAEPTVVYAVDLAASPVTVTPATEPGNAVSPAGLAVSGDRLVVCDPGQADVSGGQVSTWSRLLPCRIDVVIHFVRSRLPSPDDPGRQTVMNQVISTVRAVVDQRKPAHGMWNLVTQF
jgi:phage tail-like protein